MGTKLADLVKNVQREVNIKSLAHKVIGIDAYNMIYAFLSRIRSEGGTTLFTDEEGNVTSHLIGMYNRCVYFLSNNISPVFIFDGKPPDLKRKTQEERARIKEEAERKYEVAVLAGDFEKAAIFAQQTSRITPQILEDSFTLLKCLGLPYILAPGEAEAQGALMTRNKDLWGFASQDYDALLFGVSRALRNLAVNQTRGTPQGIRTYPPYQIKLKELFDELKISREQLILLALLIGTDYNPGVRGVGPKTALKLVSEYKSLDALIKYLKRPNLKIRGEQVNFDLAFPVEPELLFDAFYNPKVVDKYYIRFEKPKKNELINFLCEERNFNQERVKDGLSKILKTSRQSKLDSFF